MYTKEESEKIVEEAKEVLKVALSKIDLKAIGDWTSVKNTVRKELKNLFIKRTKRDPLIIPVILEN